VERKVVPQIGTGNWERPFADCREYMQHWLDNTVPSEWMQMLGSDSDCYNLSIINHHHHLHHSACSRKTAAQ